MANKAISELPQAQNVGNQDLFVLEQSGIAKKLPAETFITEQGIIDALAEALDGHGGIQSVTLQSLSGRIRTYLITFADESATTFQVLDGTSISSIQKTSTAGLVDTYTVFLNDGSTGGFFQVRNGKDGSATWDQINGKAPAITDTASGAIANFPDGAEDIPITSIVADINPVQSGSGDPSPSNIRPITGHTEVNVTRCGKNLFPIRLANGTYSGITSTLNNDGTITFTGAKTGNGNLDLYINSVNGSFNANNSIPLPAGSYKLSGITGGSGSTYKLYVRQRSTSTTSVYYVGIENGIGNFSFSTDDWAIDVYMRFYAGVTLNNPVTISPMVYSANETSSAFAPYIAPSALSLSWQTEAGTVYGGTVDVATGLLTVTDGYIASYNSETLPSTWISDRDVYAQGTTPTTGAQVVYKLATPQTYQLTGQQMMTLLGSNNVWADTGNVSVTYTADTKMFIEKLTQPTEDDMVANQAITSGKFFMVGNNLYKATTAIASGAAITPGTNATPLSLADALNLLN